MLREGAGAILILKVELFSAIYWSGRDMKTPATVKHVMKRVSRHHSHCPSQSASLRASSLLSHHTFDVGLSRVVKACIFIQSSKIVKWASNCQKGEDEVIRDFAFHIVSRE